MKLVNALLAGILVVLIYIACRNPAPIVIPPTPTPQPVHATTRWRYKMEQYYGDAYFLLAHSDKLSAVVQVFGDNNKALSSYEGGFGYLAEQGVFTNYAGSEWEMCGSFLEPKTEGSLVIIFKQPVN
jgi:hypothetical protein